MEGSASAPKASALNPPLVYECCTVVNGFQQRIAIARLLRFFGENFNTISVIMYIFVLKKES